jgi:hypothetical protein
MIDFIDPFLEEELDGYDEFRPIPTKDRLPDLEEQVRQHMLISPNLPYNNIKYEYIKIPKSFESAARKSEFWKEQIRRCKNGHDGMSPKMYFYFHFCWMENIGGGKIRPEFRVVDNEWFKHIEAAQRTGEWGVVCVKRRRVGASWKEACDVLHDCIFRKNYHVGMNSKSERDSQALLRKVKFLYNHLPPELRVRTTAGMSKMHINFSYNAKDENGNKVVKGNLSDIIVVAPENSAFEGMMLNKWVCDEAGKIENLPDMWAFTEDCLMQETRRLGTPIIFGTSGDVGKEGAGLREMWENAHLYKLKRFFFAGWMGMDVDEFGNDNKEEVIRWIIYERRRREKSQKNYNVFIQKYPLTVDEALMDHTIMGLGDPLKIKAQRASLIMNPVVSKRGLFEERDGKVVFIPDQYGPCIVYDEPKLNAKYTAGCDPADIDDVFEEASDLSMYIISHQDGLDRPKIVFEYTDRPRELNRYYQQALLALRWYNQCRVLIERQKGGRMISFFTDNHHKHLLMTTPQAILRLVPNKVLQIGLHMGPTEKEYLRGLVSEYIDNSSELIPSIPLLEEMLKFGSCNTDKAMAFGITMIALKEEMKRGRPTPTNGFKRHEPNFKYVIDPATGQVKRVKRDGPINGKGDPSGWYSF